jgi:hypothetical protein
VLRQTEARPARLSMLIAETSEGKGRQRMEINGRQKVDCEGSMGERALAISKIVAAVAS